MGVPARTKPVRAVQEVRLEDRLEHQRRLRLHDPVLDRRDTQRSQPAVRLGDEHTLDRLWPVAMGAQFLVQLLEEQVRARAIDDVLTRHAIHTGGAVVLEHQPPRGRQHVGPIDPVVQRVKPELRLLLGLLTQLPSQFGDLQRQDDSRLHLQKIRRLVLGHWSAASFRRGTFVQAVLLTSVGNTNPVGALRSTGVTPLLRSYGPLRLPARPVGGYGFPLPVDPAPYPDARSPRRVSQVPCRSFDARRPVPPRGARPLPTLVASRPVSGFNTSGRLATPACCNEAERVRLRYG